jgi:hypothetical protein
MLYKSHDVTKNEERETEIGNVEKGERGRGRERGGNVEEKEIGENLKELKRENFVIESQLCQRQSV